MHDLVTTTEPAPQLFSISELRELAGEFSKCGLFACKTQEQAFALMMLCQSEGIHAVQAMKRYHLIEDRSGRVTPSMRADAMQSDFQSKGGRVEWIRTDDDECVAKFSHPIHQPTPLEIRRTLKRYMDNGTAMAWKDSKPYLKDNWKKSPDAMLRARVISAGVRAVLPGVVTGIYTPEEVRDLEDEIPNVTAPAQPPVVTTTTRKPAATKPQATDAEFAPVDTPPNHGEGKAPPLPPDSPAITSPTQSAAAPVEGEFTTADKSPAAQTSQPAGGRGQPQPTATTNPPTSPAPGVSDAIQKLLDTPTPEELNAQRAIMTQMGIEIVKFSKETWEAIKADWKNSTSTTAKRNMIEKTRATLQELCA